jgi:membrane associated rhomboid family serine protease
MKQPGGDSMASGYGGGYGGYGRPQIRIGGPLTPAVKILLITNIAVFLLMLLPRLSPGGGQTLGFLVGYLGMTPALFWGSFTLWMPFTYLFLHGGLMHILFNMFALWMFGGDVENVFGTQRFLIYYFICGVGAGLLVAVLSPGSMVPTIGASGAIYGVLLAFGMFFPDRELLIWGIFPAKAKYFVIGIAAIVFISALESSGGGISHVAHLGGLVFGFLFIRWRMVKLFIFRIFGRKPKAKVYDIDKIRRMFEEEDKDDDQRVH